MIRTGQPPRSYDGIVYHSGVTGAAQMAQREGRQVKVSDVLRGTVRL